MFLLWLCRWGSWHQQLIHSWHNLCEPQMNENDIHKKASVNLMLYECSLENLCQVHSSQVLHLPMWPSISTIFSMLLGSIKGEVILFSTARHTPSDVWMPMAVEPNWKTMIAEQRQSWNWQIYLPSAFISLHMLVTWTDLDGLDGIFNLEQSPFWRESIHPPVKRTL